MNMIDNALGVHAQALGLRSKRMEVLARNIANADTPHFKAKDLDFASVLKQTQDATLNTTSNQHMAFAHGREPEWRKIPSAVQCLI